MQDLFTGNFHKETKQRLVPILRVIDKKKERQYWHKDKAKRQADKQDNSDIIGSILT